MALSALRGAIGFLTRLPVGRDEQAWNAFTDTPAVLPVAGYGIGGVASLALLFPVPAPTAAVLFVCWLYLLTGITHLDGVADLGDAAVVHGSPEQRREVLKDTTVGVGAVFAVVLLLAAVVLAVLAILSYPRRALLLIVTAEVSAKLGMAVVACFGTATHEGLGSQLTGATRSAILLPVIVSLPAAALTWPDPASSVAFAAGVGSTAVVVWWADSRLGGVNGDVFGACNEISRVVALHAGVIAWTQL